MWTAKQLNEKFNTLKKSFPNRCFECGLCPCELDDLCFAHLKPTKLSSAGRGKQNRYYDIVKNPDAYFLTCGVKHGEIDGRNYYVRNELLVKIERIKNIEMRY